MERLTRRDKDGKAWFKPVDPDCGSCDFAKEKCIKCYGNRAERLAAYEDAEEQGRLVVLPCKVGDTVWVNFSISGSYLRGKDRPFSCTVIFIGLNQSESGGFVNFEYSKDGFQFQLDFDAFGKNVFLNCEEAEAALRKERE